MKLIVFWIGLGILSAARAVVNLRETWARTNPGFGIEEPDVSTGDSPLPLFHHDVEAAGKIPTTFDARDKWPNCASIIGTVPDVGSCFSSWAVTTAGVISDRYCIHLGIDVMISAQDLMTCCQRCQTRPPTGCNSGWPHHAWLYWNNTGVVTGGLYNSKVGCQPYALQTCSHFNLKSVLTRCYKITVPESTPCRQKCASGYPFSFDQDKYYGKSVYRIAEKVEQIQLEIMTNGPVQSTMGGYIDFYSYKSGVYNVSISYPVGYPLAVKIIGWGVLDGTDYWLCVNHWNEEWGDKGYFKIQRGTNEADIETNVNAGIPAKKPTAKKPTA